MLARFTLSLSVALVVCSNATAQTPDADSIIGETIESLQLFRGDERPWITVENAAKETGLAGQWTVTSSVKDGGFSKAQIGQEPGDIITIGRPHSVFGKIAKIQVT